MNAALELLNKVKALFNAPPVVETPAEVPPVAAAIEPTIQTYKLKNGDVIAITIANPDVTKEPSVGDTVTIADVQAAAGEYELEDGSKITVDDKGMITDIVIAAPITTNLEDNPPGETLEQKIAKTIQDEISKLKVQVLHSELQEANKKIAHQDDVIKGLFELVEKLVEQPTANPVTLTGNKKEMFDRINKRDERLNKMAEQLKKNKVLA